MLRLNDDCLCEIFHKVTLREQLILTTVCERFREIIASLVWRPIFREVRTNSAATDALTRDEYQTLFKIIAERLDKLTIADTAHLAFTSYLGRYDWRPALPFYLSLDYPNLCELDVEDSSLHDGYMRLVALRCPALQVLRVSSAYVTGAYIKDMRQLRKLFMPKCSLSAEHLRSILYSDLPLTHLDVSGNPASEELKQTLKELEHLKHDLLVLSETNI